MLPKGHHYYLVINMVCGSCIPIQIHKKKMRAIAACHFVSIGMFKAVLFMSFNLFLYVGILIIVATYCPIKIHDA